MVQLEIRTARAEEADLLGELALRSKGHWGYDRAFLDACRAELIFEPEQLAARRVSVAESAGRVLGFYSVDGQPPSGELGNLWVEPDIIGSGVGRRLWVHAMQTARTAGFTSLHIEADPFAEGFYLAMGAERIGQTPSGSIPGRVLPMLKVRIPSPPRESGSDNSD
ncbi:GNAT family N-acetyltransferase [Micromonospora sp. C28SCA-DRY-2]|uniref:GNAT family N-acetyltransferase n=1 Tax=Micromonospora sp. C28SCA-DRY-2 TaxID=3059522 RepID=UPI002674950E|nr:GNAT family N-acetyltransferase [Micromonospora sp. C28SCA-DRY-2]MDO3705524.1 GNAT family N-acetyltransferase [Micromonospora sp. C28SCA-DRY-2]